MMTVTQTENPHNLKTVTTFHGLANHWVRDNVSKAPELNEVYQAMEHLAHLSALESKSGHICITVVRNVVDNAVIASNREKPIYIIELR
jgi:aminoglycoside N3'-acetyltransferase